MNRKNCLFLNGLLSSASKITERLYESVENKLDQGLDSDFLRLTLDSALLSLAVVADTGTSKTYWQI